MVLKSSSTGSVSLRSRSVAGQGVFYRVTAVGYPESLSHTFSLVTNPGGYRHFVTVLETKGLREGHRLSETDEESERGPLAPNLLPSSTDCAPPFERYPCRIACL